MRLRPAVSIRRLTIPSPAAFLLIVLWVNGAPAALSPRAYLASENRLVVVQGTTEVPAPAAFTVAGALTDVAVHPSGGFVYATSKDLDTVYRFTLNPNDATQATATAITDPAIAGPQYVDIAGDGTVFVLNQTDRTVSVVQNGGATVSATSVALAPSGVLAGLAVASAGPAIAWVVHPSSKKLFAIDASGSVVKTVGPLEFDPFSVAVHPLGIAVYVTFDRPKIATFFVDSSTVTSQFLHPTLTGNFRSQGLDVLTDGKGNWRMVVGTRSTDQARVYDVAADGSIGSCKNALEVGAEPAGVSATVAGDRVYVETEDPLDNDQPGRLFYLNPWNDAPQWCDVANSTVPDASRAMLIVENARFDAWNRFTAPAVGTLPTTTVVTTTTTSSTTVTTSTSTLPTTTSSSTSTLPTTTSSTSTLPTTSSSTLQNTTTTSSTSTQQTSTTSTSTLPITSTSSTSLVTTSTLQSTTSSSSSTSTVPTTSSSTSSSSSTTSTTSTTSSTSTTGDLCGNNVVDEDAGEQCDDGDRLANDDCCDFNCRRRTVGRACGDPTEDECDGPDRCDGLGNCQENRTPAGSQCPFAPEGARGNCDGGSFCNGVDKACIPSDPQAGCDVQAPEVAGANGGVVDCFAPDTFADGKTVCKMTGVEADGATVGQLATSAAASGGAVIVPKTVRFRSVVDGKRRKSIPLKLNKRGKKLLKQRPELLVLVKVNIRNDVPGRPSRPVERLVRFRRR